MKFTYNQTYLIYICRNFQENRWFNVSVMIESISVALEVPRSVDKKEWNPDIKSIRDEGIKGASTFFRHKPPPFDRFEKGASFVFHLWNLAVHKNYRRRGLGFTLFDAVVDLAKELRFKALAGTGTSDVSKLLFE